MTLVNLRFKQSTPKHLGLRWTPDEKRLLAHHVRAGKTFQQIAETLNRYRAKAAQDSDFGNHYFVRTDRAAALQARKLNLITQEELVQWETERQRSRARNRSKHRNHARAAVFKRDDGRCVVCRRTDQLQFAHIIPFEKSRRNDEREAVTLCSVHHRHFDDGCPDCLRKVFRHMCSLYVDYSHVFSLEAVGRRRSRIERKKVDRL